jgi:4-hydroxythreonine-4-phosphate dehydrogenase
MVNAETFTYTICNNADQATNKAVNIINCITEEVIIQPGADTASAGNTAFISLESATREIMANKIDMLVTAPINKKNMQQRGFDFHGHTEYFNSKAGTTDNLMLLVNDNLKVGLATNHLPLRDVSAALSVEGILKKIEIFHQSLIQDFALQKPVIAVLSLNPHAGDKGLLGNEEQTIIIPAIKQYLKMRISIYS